MRRFLVRLGIVFLLFSGASRADGIDAGILTQSIAFTTNSNHKLEVYLNLASRMKLTDTNQLWVADTARDWSRAARQGWEQRFRNSARLKRTRNFVLVNDSLCVG